MSAAANPEIDDPAADWARPLYAAQIAMLGELAETGMELVRGIKASATEPEADAARAFIDFTRIARAVRLTLLLQARLIKDLEDRDRCKSWEATCERKRQVKRIVGRIADRDARALYKGDRLEHELRERIDQDDIYGPVLNRPLGELIGMICKDLGLDADWPRLSQEAWAQREAATTDPFRPHRGRGTDREAVGEGPMIGPETYAIMSETADVPLHPPSRRATDGPPPPMGEDFVERAVPAETG